MSRNLYGGNYFIIFIYFQVSGIYIYIYICLDLEAEYFGKYYFYAFYNKIVLLKVE